MHSMLTQPQGPVSQSSCVSSAHAVPGCAAQLSNLID
ncbi:hypothetical protein IEO21_10546 [Rhodonia placenta]|uniref:Uncharacterized protein n=1 Tax=Rhodonia placenta TaxID=104341 RepID=A0A8H7NSA4_9APHY|nr:hypothetical protein IEO21_10546 [Postia placenta]